MPRTGRRLQLGDITYYGIGGSAQSFFFPQTAAELQRFLSQRDQQEALAVLGAGSNSICSENEFPGTIISCQELSYWGWVSPNGLVCGSGVSNTEVAEIALDAGFIDAAWMFRMPGQLGATVRMNARCYGGEISQIVSEVSTLNLRGEFARYSSQDLFLGYKSTILMSRKEIVTDIVFQFQERRSRSEILKKMEEHEKDRHRKKHFAFPSCGSTFKNNYSVGRPSGQIFDELSLKGEALGNAKISDHHANFIYNLGDATSQDVLSLAAKMRQKALGAGIDLELEVQPIGLFPKDLAETLNFSHLDADTTEYPQDDEKLVLTGILSPGLTDISTKQKRNERNNPPRMSTRLVPWAREHRPYPDLTVEMGKKPNGTLIVNFLIPLAQRDLLGFLPPPHPGFQDFLWTFGAVEVFIWPPDDARQDYLELQCQDERNRLALRFAGPRKRAEVSSSPSARDFPGFVTRTRIEGDTAQLSMEVPKMILKDYMIEDHILIKFAWCSGAANHFALSPHPGKYALTAPPDFHRKQESWLCELSTLPTLSEADSSGDIPGP